MMSWIKKLNAEFWAGQLFTIFATIIGVYLAANSGFEKAIEFDNITNARQSYYVQKALFDELQDNLQKTQVWTEEFNKNPQRNDMHLALEKYQYQYYLWQTIQESSAVFEVPYRFVGGINQFYTESENLKKTMLSGNPFTAPKAATELQTLAKQTQQKLLQELKDYLQTQQQKLSTLGVELNK